MEGYLCTVGSQPECILPPYVPIAARPRQYIQTSHM